MAAYKSPLPSPNNLSGSLPIRVITKKENHSRQQSIDRANHFKLEKERLKEAAAALDREGTLVKRTKETMELQKAKKMPPDLQPQVSTPVPSNIHHEKLSKMKDLNSSAKKDQRISTMSDSQIMEKLSKLLKIENAQKRFICF